jgi:hypothetical protein
MLEPERPGPTAEPETPGPETLSPETSDRNPRPCRFRAGSRIRPVVVVLKLGLAFLPPGVQVQLVGENRALLTLDKPPHGQTQTLLPALDGPDFLIKVCRNLFPRIEAIVGQAVIGMRSLAKRSLPGRSLPGRSLAAGQPSSWLCPVSTHSSFSPRTRACRVAQGYRAYALESNPVAGIEVSAKDCAGKD